jgi:hypothetical protein
MQRRHPLPIYSTEEQAHLDEGSRMLSSVGWTLDPPKLITRRKSKEPSYTEKVGGDDYGGGGVLLNSTPSLVAKGNLKNFIQLFSKQSVNLKTDNVRAEMKVHQITASERVTLSTHFDALRDEVHGASTALVHASFSEVAAHLFELRDKEGRSLRSEVVERVNEHHVVARNQENMGLVSEQ